MKKYLLIVFGEFKSKDICEDIAVTISPIVDSPHLKFQHIKGNLIFHFASEVSHEEIHDYINGVLYGFSDMFILTQCNDKMSLHMPEDVQKHLFNLDYDDDSIEMNVDMNRIKNNLDFMEEEENFVALLLDEVRSRITEPTLDQILEKITSKGVESLSMFEKDVLDNYSKN